MPGLVEDVSEEIIDVQSQLSSWAYRIVTAACERKEQHIHSMEQHRGSHFRQCIRRVINIHIYPPPPGPPSPRLFPSPASAALVASVQCHLAL